MKSNWSKKSQSLAALIPNYKLNADSPAANKIYYDEDLFISLNSDYPLRLNWMASAESTPEELLVLFISLQQLSESMTWLSWVNLKARELENFLRDHNHLPAIPVELLDLKKVDFFVELLFEEHFKLRLQSFLQQIPANLSSNYLENHKFLNNLFVKLSGYLNPGQESTPLITLYQISPKEVIFRGEKSFPLKFSQLLAGALSGHFALCNLKFVAIEL
jgi:hypothetical protein